VVLAATSEEEEEEEEEEEKEEEKDDDDDDDEVEFLATAEGGNAAFIAQNSKRPHRMEHLFIRRVESLVGG